jgi:hypothetical protein
MIVSENRCSLCANAALRVRIMLQSFPCAMAAGRHGFAAPQPPPDATQSIVRETYASL